VPQVKDALNDAFYGTFQNVAPTGKRHYLGIDCSASMSWPGSRINNTHIHAREGAAAMAMVTIRTEDQSYALAFSDGMYDLGLSRSMRLGDVIAACDKAPASYTDCSAPMRDAREGKIPVDAFIVYTDNDTNSGGTEHPIQALDRYRQAMGIDAKLIVVSMVSNGHSIADPNDAGTLDITGFDANTPAVISEFVGYTKAPIRKVA
jgi:60 kDa SS-A/Ro ribonucleoprotein